MTTPKLIKRKRDFILEIEVSSENKKRKRLIKCDGYGITITSVVMMSKRIDEFEGEIRKKLESEMRIFSSTVHSQEFLRSLVPSLNKDKDKK